jgi:hypothetical protein
MNRILSLLLWIILLLSILLSACPYKPKETLFLTNQETKDYCLFGEGSYWIYQDSATLKIDSMVINNPIIHSWDIGEWSNGDLEKREIFYTPISYYSTDSMKDVKVKLKVGVLSSTHLIYFSGTIGHDLLLTTFREQRDSLSINGITYRNIKIFEHRTLFYHEGKAVIDNYCWAKHIGIIRMERYEVPYYSIGNEKSIFVKNLIRYNVKPYKP